MPSKAPTVVGLGEFLWDFLPGGKELGGAPANFCHAAKLLGNEAWLVSSVGLDDLGKEMLSKLSEAGLPTDYIQQDPVHPTGTVKVDVDPKGQPSFEIVEEVAWDYIEWTPGLASLAGRADAVCFGSLAQRCSRSRETTHKFLREMRPESVRVFDVNLRQSFYSAKVISESLALASVVKLNHDELPIVARLLGLKNSEDEVVLLGELLEKYGLDLGCLTRGPLGSLLVSRTRTIEHPGFKIKVKDTVGAGDAFMAGVVHSLLRKDSLETVSDTGNRMGAWVASQPGGMPVPQNWDINDVLSSL